MVRKCMLVHLFSLGAHWQLNVSGDFRLNRLMYEIYVCMQKAKGTEKARVFQSITRKLNSMLL